MKKISFLTIFCILFSCNSNVLFKQEIVDFLDNEITKTLPRKDGLVNISNYTSLPLFVLVENNKLASTNIEQLYNIYKSLYNNDYNKFKVFLSESLNQEKIFKEKDFENTNSNIFIIDDIIRTDYKNMEFDDFFDKYFIKKDDYININKEKFNNRKQLFTLMYYLSINNYYCSLDDYGGGIWYVKNWNNIIKK